LSDEDVLEYLSKYQQAFIERFTKVIVEMADSSETALTNNEQFAQDLRRLSNLEREIFEQHRRSRLAFVTFKGRMSNY